jgi:hypothetical protein
MVDRPTYVTKLPVELSSIRVIPDSTAEAFIVAPGRIRVRGKSEGPAVIHIKGRRNSETAEYIEDSFEVDVLRPTKIELEHDCEDPTYVAGLAALLPYDLQTSQGTVRGEQLYPVRVEPEGAARIIPKSSDHEVLALSFAEDAREVELRSTVVEQEHPYLLTLEPKQIDQLDGFALVQGGTAKRLPWISFSFGEPFVVDTLAVIDGRPQCAMHVPTKLTVATGGCEVLFGTGEWKKEERYSPVGRFVLRNDGGSGSSCTLELAVVGAAAAMVSEDASPYLEIEAREQGRPSPSPSSSSSSFDFD